MLIDIRKLGIIPFGPQLEWKIKRVLLLFGPVKFLQVPKNIWRLGFLGSQKHVPGVPQVQSFQDIFPFWVKFGSAEGAGPLIGVLGMRFKQQIQKLLRIIGIEKRFEICNKLLRVKTWIYSVVCPSTDAIGNNHQVVGGNQSVLSTLVNLLRVGHQD